MHSEYCQLIAFTLIKWTAMKNRRPYHNSKCSLFYEAYFAHMNSAPGIDALTYLRGAIT